MTVSEISLLARENAPTVIRCRESTVINSRHAINPFEAEAQIYQHARQRVDNRPARLALQLLTNLWSHDLYLIEHRNRKERNRPARLSQQRGRPQF